MNRLFRSILLITLFIPLFFVSCNDDAAQSGSSILDKDDAIEVYADTFSLTSSLFDCPNIISSPDSFLLGEMETSFGTMRAEILTQMACPEGFIYPEQSTLDSICLFLYYTSWTGDGKSPLQIQVQELDKATMHYAQRYETDINISDYCSGADSTFIATTDRIVIAAESTDSIYNSSTGNVFYAIRFRLTDEFAQRFFSIRSFESQDQFNELFKGLYISTAFGGSTVLNITDISLGVYYHFDYQDTTFTDVKGFYANSEVRQVNRIDYQDKANQIGQLQQDPNYNYIISPSGIYTYIDLPMKQMQNTITERLSGRKRPYVNMARIQVDVVNMYDGAENDRTRDDWMQPASHMLLVKADSMSTFFNQKLLPQNDLAILSSLTTGQDSLGYYTYHYDFDISTLLTYQLRGQSQPDTLRMALVPVDVETNVNSTYGTTTVIGIQQSQTLSTTIIKGAHFTDSPMSLEVVYSGF